MTTRWDETHTTDFDHTTAYRIEAKPDGLHLYEFDPEHGEPRAYMDNFLTIPKALVPWFAESVATAAARAPLFESFPRKEVPSDEQ